MTIQTGLLRDGVAHLWTDTAHWDPATGKRVLVCGKVYGGTLWPWAVAISGDSHGSIEQLAQFQNLTPSALLRDARTALQREAAEGRVHRLLFAWPHAEHGAEMVFIMSEAAPGVEPFQAISVRKYLCWGKDAEWFRPFKDKDLTPAEMREIVKLQMDNYDFTNLPNGADDTRSDIIETRVDAQGVQHRQLRLTETGWSEVPLGDGFGWLVPEWSPAGAELSQAA